MSATAALNQEHYPQWEPAAYNADGDVLEWRCKVCQWTTTHLLGPA
jgi:hypothetical protein